MSSIQCNRFMLCVLTIDCWVTLVCKGLGVGLGGVYQVSQTPPHLLFHRWNIWIYPPPSPPWGQRSKPDPGNLQGGGGGVGQGQVRPLWPQKWPHNRLQRRPRQLSPSRPRGSPSHPGGGCFQRCSKRGDRGYFQWLNGWATIFTMNGCWSARAFMMNGWRGKCTIYRTALSHFWI